MKAAIFPKIIDHKEATLILGSFESLHNGHMKLIVAAQKFKKPIAMMLIKDPSLLPGHSKINFAPIETRLENLAILGIAKVSVINFNENIRLMSGQEFVAKIVEATHAKQIVVGNDFGCGRGRSYKAQAIAQDFQAQIIPEYKVNGKKLGTSLLKEMVQTGEVDLIKKVSPFPYSVTSTINENMRFNFTNSLKPHAGIYVVDAIINDMRFWGYVHVSMGNLNTLYLADLKIKNRQFKAKISFHKMSRIIIAKSEDVVKSSDQKRIQEYFRA